MKNHCPHRLLWAPVIMVWIVFLIGCGPGSRPLESILDTPQHYVSNGFKLIQKERFDDAGREFEYALRLESEYSPAYRGMGLVYGIEGRFDRAFDFMEKAEFYSKKNEDKALAHVGFMRLYTLKRGKDWFNEVETHFSLANSRFEDLPDAYYYLGIALKLSHRFSESKKAFNRVKKINRALISETERELKVLKKIEKAMPVHEVGKAIAVLDYITRADAAALFIHELQLENVYENLPSTFSPVPVDSGDHQFLDEIIRILPLNIRNLKVDREGRFRPDDVVTRAEYAVMIADIILKIEDDDALPMRYAGRASPFRDIRENAAYFNAVMICTEYVRVMETEDDIFNPRAKISGAEALLVIRKIKNNLGIISCLSETAMY